MNTDQPAAAGYGPLDVARNFLTVAAAVGLTVFHRDVSAFIPAAAYLVAGADVTATHLLKGKGGILHRLEAAAAGFATTVGQVVHFLPSSTPAAVAKAASEAGAIAGEVAPLVATVYPSGVTGTSAPAVTVNVNTPQAPQAAPPVAPSPVPAAGSDSTTPIAQPI